LLNIYSCDITLYTVHKRSYSSYQ
ncbi:unnamed protein product, partial [Allacma fusca]